MPANLPNWPQGTHVLVMIASGVERSAKTRAKPHRLPDGSGVVLLDGCGGVVQGAYDLTAVKLDPGYPLRKRADNGESKLLKLIRLDLGKDPRVALWHNSTGVAIADYGAAGLLPLRYGLVKGSSDLIGLVAPYGRMLALEVKAAKGVVSAEQVLFMALVNRMGGVAREIRSIDEARQAVDDATKPAIEVPK